MSVNCAVYVPSKLFNTFASTGVGADAIPAPGMIRTLYASCPRLGSYFCTFPNSSRETISNCARIPALTGSVGSPSSIAIAALLGNAGGTMIVTTPESSAPGVLGSPMDSIDPLDERPVRLTTYSPATLGVNEIW